MLLCVEVILAGAQVAAQGAGLRAPSVGAPMLCVLASEGLLAGLGAALEITGLTAQVVSRAAVAWAFVLRQQTAELAAIKGFVLPVLAILAAGVGDLFAHVCARMASLLGALMHGQSLPCNEKEVSQILKLGSNGELEIFFGMLQKILVTNPKCISSNVSTEPLPDVWYPSVVACCTLKGLACDSKAEKMCNWHFSGLFLFVYFPLVIILTHHTPKVVQYIFTEPGL